MSARRPILAALLATTLLAPQPGHAATTAEDAQSLQSALHDWLADLIGPLLPPGVQPVMVSTDGDGFRLRVESPAALDAVVPHGSAISLRATRIEGGRWALDNLALPSPLTITLPFGGQPPAPPPVTTPPVTTQPGQPPAPRPVAPPVPTTITLNTDKSVYHGIFDPSLLSESHFETLTEGQKSIGERSQTSVARGESSTRWEKMSADGRITIHTDSRAEETHQHFVQPNGTPGDMSWAHSVTTGQVSNLSPARLKEAIQTLAPLLATGNTPGVTPEQQAQWHRFLDALFDLASGVDSQSDLTDVQFSLAPIVASVKNARIGAQIAAPDGVLSVGMRMALHGVQSPSVPPGVFQELMPHDIVFAPRLGGISRERLHAFLREAIDNTSAADPKKAQAASTARMMAGGVSLGIDELSFNLGPAQLDGAGAMEITGPQQITASADIIAHGLDQLLARVAQEPQLAQAVPVLTLARGLGKPEGDGVRWHIDVRNNVTLINGFDIAALTGQKPPSAAGTAGGARPTPAPAPPR